MSRNHHLICLPHHASKIIDGTKTTTIRSPRARPIAVGDTITFARWTAKPYRSKQQRVRVVTVTVAQSITVNRNMSDMRINGESCSPMLARSIALQDGFNATTELIDYLTSEKQPEFSGFIYGWEHESCQSSANS